MMTMWRPDYDNIPTEPPEAPTAPLQANGDRPGDQYNADPNSVNHSLTLLLQAGWKVLKQRRDGVYLLQRPGTPDRNHNATLGAPESGTGLHCFTGNDPTFGEGHHSHFEILTKLAHGGDYSAAARHLAGTPETPNVTLVPANVDPETGEIIEDDGLPEPLDLTALMSGDPPETTWIIEPLIPAGRLTGLVASRGIGKSLLILDVLARRAAGLAVLDQPASDPINVVYLDYEMGAADLYDRLADLGWTIDNPDFETLVAHLHYYQLPDMPPLDTAEGGEAVEQITERHNAQIIAIDTLSRVISIGGENDAEPYKELYRHTEMRLKRQERALIRIDHLGKDTSRGSRGHSAKEDALDVIWQMEKRSEESFVLTRTKGRISDIAPKLVVTRSDDGPILRHDLEPLAIDRKIIDAAQALDRYGLDPAESQNEHGRTLRTLGIRIRTSAVRQVVEYRRRRPMVSLIRENEDE